MDGMLLLIGIAWAVFSFGAVYAFVPIIIIVILIAAAAGLSRGMSIFSAFGIGAIIGIGGSFGGGGRGKALHKQGYGGNAVLRGAASKKVQGKKFGVKPGKTLKNAGKFVKKLRIFKASRSLKKNQNITNALSGLGKKAMEGKGLKTGIEEGAVIGGIGFSTMLGSRALSKMSKRKSKESDALSKAKTAAESLAAFGAQKDTTGAGLSAPHSAGDSTEKPTLLQHRKLNKLSKRGDKIETKLKESVEKTGVAAVVSSAKAAKTERKALYSALKENLGKKEVRDLMRQAKHGVGDASDTEATNKALTREQRKEEKKQKELKDNEDRYYGHVAKADELAKTLGEIQAMNEGNMVKGLDYKNVTKHEIKKQENYIKQINKKVDPEAYAAESAKLEHMKGVYNSSRAFNDLKKAQEKEMEALKERQDAELKSFAEKVKPGIKGRPDDTSKGEVKDTLAGDLAALNAKHEGQKNELLNKHNAEIERMKQEQADSVQREQLRIMSASPELMLKKINENIENLKDEMRRYSKNAAPSKGPEVPSEEIKKGGELLAQLTQMKKAIEKEQEDLSKMNDSDRGMLLGAILALSKSMRLEGKNIEEQQKAGVFKKPKNLAELKKKDDDEKKAEAERIREEIKKERERKAAEKRRKAAEEERIRKEWEERRKTGEV